MWTSVVVPVTVVVVVSCVVGSVALVTALPDVTLALFLPLSVCISS